jgi:ferrochelatase
MGAENTDRVGVLLMAYGTPRSRHDIEDYYTDIRRGRPPTPEALADLVARYDAIGGISPLATLTEEQRDALQAALDEREPDRFHVTLGLKHAEPKVESGAAALSRAGFRTIVGLVLAPHFSSYSIGQYQQRARDGVDATEYDATVIAIESWATERAFVDFLADDLRSRHEAMAATLADAGDHRRVRVVFTAHSLPRRIIDAGDPYPDELRSTAEAVADELHLLENDDWMLGWQSAGRTPEPWIGPDILDVIDGLGRDPDVGGVIVSACGFVADHLEVLYDLDIEARHRADDAGLLFDRTACVNDDPEVMSALAARVIDAVGAVGE